jgi:hypothetical protein
MVRGPTAFVCASVLAVALATVPSASGLAVTFNIKVAKHKDGPYKTDIRSKIDPGETRSFWFRVKNTGDAESQLDFGDADTSDEVGFKTKWFKHGDNVSSQVQQGGYMFHVDPGQKKYFNAKQTGLDAPGAVEGCLAGEASMTMVYTDLSSVAINGGTCVF